jgi:hypothetical protein
LRPHALAEIAGASSPRAASPTYLIETAAGRRRFQIGLKGVLIIVACCAPLFWVARELWDRRPENAPVRAVRMLRSENAGERKDGARELTTLVLIRRVTPKQTEALIPDLLRALRDNERKVREAAAFLLFDIVFRAGQGSTSVPKGNEIAAALAEALHDSEPKVRRYCSHALAGLYFTYSSGATPQAPLPQKLDRFLDSLCGAIEHLDHQESVSVLLALHAIGPRVELPAPQTLVRALHSKCAGPVLGWRRHPFANTF